MQIINNRLVVVLKAVNLVLVCSYAILARIGGELSLNMLIKIMK